MPTILATILPIFLLIGLGYASARFGLFTPPQVQGLARFVLYVALPALIFQSLAGRALSEIVQPAYLLAYALGSLGAYAAGFLWFRSRADRRSQAAILGLGMSMSNTGFIGAPLALQFFGEAAAVPIALTFVVENAVMLPIGLALAHVGPSSGKGGRLRSTLEQLAKSPLILAVLLGTLFALLSLRLPPVLARAVGLLAGASAPAALFAIGAGLVGVRLHGRVGAISTIAVGKLILHPLLMTLFVLLLPMRDPLLGDVAIFLAAVPMLSIFPLLAARAGDQEVSGPALLATTVSSFFTLTGIAWLLSWWGPPA